MSKYIIYGEKISHFLKRRGKGAWIAKNRENAVRLQRIIGASACRAGIRVSCKTLPAIKDDKIIYILTAEIK